VAVVRERLSGNGIVQQFLLERIRFCRTVEDDRHRSGVACAVDVLFAAFQGVVSWSNANAFYYRPQGY
jgi:hypothetical protein